MKVSIVFILLLQYIRHIISKEPVIKSKTLLEYSTEKCRTNPMLNLLPENMKYKAEITLLSKPKNSREEFCKIPEGQSNESILNCCTYFTYSIIKTYLNDHLYLAKQNIHDRNLYYFKQLYDEHKRNFVKGFGIEEIEFETIFSELHEIIKKVINLAQSIVNESVQYNWDAFCNYICYFPSAIKQNCKVYKVIYIYNDVEYEDYEYECKEDKERIKKMRELISEFISIKEDLNKTFNGIYQDIRTKAKAKFQSQLGLEIYTLLENSINDGNYVSLDLNKEFLCDHNNNTTYILNDYVNNTIIKINTSCVMVKDNPCGIFSCLDDFFMQFFDVTEFNSSYIMKHFNYTKSKVNLTDKADMFAFTYENEIDDLLDGRLKFDSGFKININILSIIFFVSIFYII